MLGKLMKHEFHATGRIGLPLCGIMLALSVFIWRQCSFLVLAILLMLVAKRDHKGALMTLIGFVVTLLLVWGLLLILNVDLCKYIAW